MLAKHLQAPAPARPPNPLPSPPSILEALIIRLVHAVIPRKLSLGPLKLKTRPSQKSSPPMSLPSSCSQDLPLAISPGKDSECW